MEQTLALIKPDAVRAGKARDIFHLIQRNGFTVLTRNKTQLKEDDAMEFYKEHKEKPFYEKLVGFMTSGPIWAILLSKKDAILQWRTLMGPTNSCIAKDNNPESIRGMYGTDGTYNAVHGSDSFESARREIKFFFPNWRPYIPPLKDEEVGAYVKSSMQLLAPQLNSVLIKGLTEMAKMKPTSDSLEAAQFLGQWLLQNNPANPIKTIPSSMDNPEAALVASGVEETTKNDLKFSIKNASEETAVMIPAPPTVEETETQAATIVQAAYKGYKTRKALKSEGPASS
eukprot:g1379.t1